jgi:hypothetical protein
MLLVRFIVSKKTELKDLKSTQFNQKRKHFKADDKKSVVVKEIVAIKKKSSTLHWDNKKKMP